MDPTRWLQDLFRDRNRIANGREHVRVSIRIKFNTIDRPFPLVDRDRLDRTYQFPSSRTVNWIIVAGKNRPCTVARIPRSHQEFRFSSRFSLSLSLSLLACNNRTRDVRSRACNELGHNYVSRGAVTVTREGNGE